MRGGTPYPRAYPRLNDGAEDLSAASFVFSPAALAPGGAPVTTDILQGGLQKGKVTVPNRIGWYEAKVEIAPDAPIELRITTPRDGRRHHCINAKVVESPK